jgi:hypothetical protein
MTYLVDTEGETLPRDCDGSQTFDINLYGSDRDDGNVGSLYLSLSVPMYFQVNPDEGGGIYSSAGVLKADFKEVMEEYLEDIYAQDGGKYAKSIASYLRDYADRLDAIEPTDHEASA